MSQKRTESISGGRVDSLDYLRGLAAFGIMVYHMVLFNFGEVDASSVLAKVKIFGVAIFYILSGLTLYIVNVNRLFFNKNDLVDFYIKRFFRIVPLLWLVTFLTIVIEYHFDLPLKKVLLNFSIVPGIIRPGSFLANGAWSIGNELFFYLLFPFLIFITRRNHVFLWITTALALLVFLYFTFFILDPGVPLGKQWYAYVNPFNQVLFFVLGIFIGTLDNSSVKYSRVSFLILLLVLGGVLFYPVTGEPIVLVSTYVRIILSIGIFVVCFLFYKSNFEFLPRLVTSAFRFLGEISYSLYLIHPLVLLSLIVVARKTDVHSIGLIIAATMVLSVAVSYLSYRFFEKSFIAIGRSVSKRLLNA